MKKESKNIKEASRNFALVIYGFSILMFILAGIECYFKAPLWHLVIFIGYITTYIIAIVSAFKYNLSSEIRLLYLLMFFTVVNIISVTIIKFHSIGVEVATSWVLILVLQLLYFSHRLLGLRRLKQDIIHLKAKGVL